MLIKYIGGRSRYDLSFNRKPFYFTSENNRILDIKDKAVRDYIFSLPNRGEFETIEAEIPAEENVVEQKTEEPKLIKKDKFKKGRK